MKFPTPPYFFYYLLLVLIYSNYAYSQQVYQSESSITSIQKEIEKLSVLGSVLYFAAHPDDENTRLIAWLAGEKKYKTTYLSLTRGDGGQNLIGKEIGIELGLIRTQELLNARRIDGGEQLFSSAYDFGFSKTYDETFQFWNKQTILKEAVWIIRKHKPDIIITRFPPDPRGGHGHHQASAILAHEAFIAAADPTVFPEQLDQVDVWQAKRILWNTANFGGMNNTSEDQLKIDIGGYNSLRGLSYGEIAAMSRSQHKSQGFGAAGERGQIFEYFAHVDGDKAERELLEGVDTSWGRIENVADIQKLINHIQHNFDWQQPENSISDLFKLRNKLEQRKENFWINEKLQAINKLIFNVAGIYVQSTSSKSTYTAGELIQVQNEIVVRKPNLDIQLLSLNDQSIEQDIPYHRSIFIPNVLQADNQVTQPYWLVKKPLKGRFDVPSVDSYKPENDPILSNTLTFRIGTDTLRATRVVHYKYVDPVNGEIEQPISIVPELTATASSDIVILKDNTREVNLTFKNNHPDKKTYSIQLATSAGFKVFPQELNLTFEGESQEIQISVKISASSFDQGTLSIQSDGHEVLQTIEINYDHIPKITWHKPCVIQLQNIDLKVPIHKIGYIAGAGDKVAESLTNVGIQVDQLKTDEIDSSILKNYDAVVVGVRAYNVLPALREKSKALLDYVHNGGTLLIQYNVASHKLLDPILPKPFSLSRSRVTEEDSPVTIISPNHPALNYPNKITLADFDNWVQERGLYFAENIDPSYETPFLMHDLNEEPHPGSVLILPHGKGRFVYTSLSFFRQLPAGVPGSYRLFINLLCLETNN